MTSRDVVNAVQRLLPRKTKVGHAGTLDPLATGVLIVCVGAATRLVDRVQDDRKGYRAGLKLGIRSDTDDITGQVVSGGDPARITTAQLETALREFQGQQAQVPPRFSAVHVDGQRAYDLARADREFELTARTVQVDTVTLLRHDADQVEIEIVCGSGTYVRSLIRDLGERLGCGAVMTSLVRTFIGPYLLATALPVEQLTADTLVGRLLPMVSALGDDVRYAATAAECTALLQGRGLACSDQLFADGQRVAVLDDQGELFAFAEWHAEKQLLLPQRVFVR